MHNQSIVERSFAMVDTYYVESDKYSSFTNQMKFLNVRPCALDKPFPLFSLALVWSVTSHLPRNTNFPAPAARIILFLNVSA